MTKYKLSENVTDKAYKDLNLVWWTSSWASYFSKNQLHLFSHSGV